MKCRKCIYLMGLKCLAKNRIVDKYNDRECAFYRTQPIGISRKGDHMWEVTRERDGETVTVAVVDTFEEAGYELEELREEYGPEWTLNVRKVKRNAGNP